MNSDAAFAPAFHLPGNFFPQRVSHLLGILWAVLNRSSQKRDPKADRLQIEAALSGDPGFERLVKAYESMVYRTAFRFLGQEADALDVTQEVFIRVHKSLSKFRGDSSLSTWIYAITANLSKNALRSRKNRGKLQVLAPAGEKTGANDWLDKATESESHWASRLAESHEFQKRFQKALDHLPADYKEAVVLRDLEDLDYEKIAEILKTGLGTVKSRIARGRAHLRDQLKDWL
jgi:RNA polymerase sigma-70 factor (ECF subfamily)